MRRGSKLHKALNRTRWQVSASRFLNEMAVVAGPVGKLDASNVITSSRCIWVGLPTNWTISKRCVWVAILPRHGVKTDVNRHQVRQNGVLWSLNWSNPTYTLG